MFARTTFTGYLSNKFGSAFHASSKDLQRGKAYLRMRKTTLTIAAVSAALLAVAGCSSSKSKGGGNTSAAPGGNTTAAPPATSAPATTGGGGKLDGKGAKVGIILPDTQSSARWANADQPALEAQCKADNLDCDIQNAQGDKAKMRTIAQSMESEGVKVLMIVNLDPASGATIEKEAANKGITTIDYDRLTPGGGAAVYVSFDNVKVGEEQGSTLVNCPQVKGKSAVNYVDVNGSPTDNNAGLFKQGYDSVLSKQAGWKKLADQSVPDWDNQKAGTIFSSMLNAHHNINAVMVANDGMANSVIGALKNQNLAGKVAVSGQDATAQGLQHILKGDQCFSIYKPSKLEAIPAIDAIATIVTGGLPKTNGQVQDPVTKKQVPSILATPVAITKDNVADPINDGYTPKDQVCTGSYASLCTKAGVK
jgi:D-xylose transport system substrate-binding protein